jgi:hypothetical protein
MNNENKNNSENENENKRNIIITGTNNRYLIKRANRVQNVPKKRAIIEKYNLPAEYLNFDKQLLLLKNICEKKHKLNTEMEILLKEINNKISSYKQQDLLKNNFDETNFITTDIILNKLLETNMNCYYCKCEMYILYEHVRELKQWSVDRIDNTKGHNKDNFVLSCLNCNIKRRNKSSDKFLFTKQLNLVKK